MSGKHAKSLQAWCPVTRLAGKPSSRQGHKKRIQTVLCVGKCLLRRRLYRGSGRSVASLDTAEPALQLLRSRGRALHRAGRQRGGAGIRAEAAGVRRAVFVAKVDPGPLRLDGGAPVKRAQAEPHCLVGLVESIVLVGVPPRRNPAVGERCLVSADAGVARRAHACVTDRNLWGCSLRAVSSTPGLEWGRRSSRGWATPSRSPATAGKR